MPKILNIPARAIAELSEVQRSIFAWARAAFQDEPNGLEVAPDIRCLRFVEEAIELAQAQGLTKELVLKQVEEVYSRPTGKVYQEMGGCGVTLMAYAESVSFPLGFALDNEISRINSKPIKHFQDRQKEKMAKGLKS